ncbi:MAG: AtpZ/AtpI family protein, partial [bacterium]|nr:AtpZ/AtpI family protein [bacterium]
RLRGEGSRRPGQRTWLRVSGFGIELAGAVGGFCLLGFWIDRQYDTSPWGLLVCAIFGLIGGFYNFFRSSLKALNPPESPGPDTGDDSKQ